jgi:1-acyl-sn-glycerol-3-phosphate acyltransferase
VAYWVLKVLLTPVFLVLWRVKVEGRQYVPKQGPAILAANHQSFCDSFFIPLVVTRKVTFLAKAEYFDSWRTAWFFRAAGQIPIRRGGGPVSERALATACEVLAQGKVLGVYPEGTRARDTFVHRGRTGVARLALDGGVPVIPVGITGTRRVQPIGARLMRPFRAVTIRFGPPMQLEACDSDTSETPDTPDTPDGSSVRRATTEKGDEDPAVNGSSERLRRFTDDLMHRIAELSDRSYLDEYVGAGASHASTPSRNGLETNRALSANSVAMVSTYRLRIRLPDRPGALGLVASRIGSVGGDIVSIDILGRDDGRAVDEFVVELAGRHLIDLLHSEIHEVDGVAIEDFRSVEQEGAATED